MQLSRQGSVTRRVPPPPICLKKPKSKHRRVEAAGRCRARVPRIRRRGPAAAKAVLCRLPSYVEEEQEAEQERYAPAG